MATARNFCAPLVVICERARASIGHSLLFFLGVARENAHNSAARRSCFLDHLRTILKYARALGVNHFGDNMRARPHFARALGVSLFGEHPRKCPQQEGQVYLSPWSFANAPQLFSGIGDHPRRRPQQGGPAWIFSRSFANAPQIRPEIGRYPFSGILYR